MTMQSPQTAAQDPVSRDRPLRVVISNGAKNFHLSSAAAETDARGNLLALFNGIYPKTWVHDLVHRLGLHRWSRAKRMLARGVRIDEKKVEIFWLADLIIDFAIYMTRYPRLQTMVRQLNRQSMRIFAGRARALMTAKFRDCDIYHYRAGFGLTSVDAARKNGAIQLCDHSIVHPLILDAMIKNGGHFPADVGACRTSGIWDLVLQDIEVSDHVLVNSDFVKQTFLHAGFDPERVSVIYLGVDDAFLEGIPPRVPKAAGEPVRFLFAGSFSKRKGADTLIAAIQGLPEHGWSLEIAGPVETSLQPSLQKLLERPEVRHLGNLSRADLAKAMARADVFVFPSLAEGSARVVFEALACGCFVITTPNTGSIVEDKVHGRLVPPGDRPALQQALADILRDQAQVTAIGAANAALIRSHYSQHSYGEALQALYRRLMDGRALTATSIATSRP